MGRTPQQLRNPLEFPDALQKLADIVTEQTRRVESQMHSEGCKGGPVPCCIAAKAGISSDVTDALVKLTTAYGNLGKEIRQWSGHVKTSLDTMSPAKKAQVMIAWLLDQPLSARRDVYTVLARRESDRPDGLGLVLSDRFGTTPGPAVE